ncbi:MAG: hypothetical protein MSS28_04520 [Tenericutes bacterium]|nr:hypothetical protein [Mycoplasmatota bacterium]
MKEQQKLIKSIALVLIVAIPVIILLSKNVKTTQKEENKKTKSLLSAVLKKNNQTQEEANYKKFVSGEVLNENTSFLEYAFITNNTAYIFNPAKLKTGELSYKKAYDIPNNIKVMNIVPSLGADINFIDYTDTLYSIYDNNIDNDPVDDYSMFEKATYELKTLATNNYSEKYLDKKMAYDFTANNLYVKDNILYNIIPEYYHFQNKVTVPTAYEKISGNYEGEKIIRIYNERILKTDKGFYEIVDYYDTSGKKTTTMKIDLLTKYYNEVLTFTYEYVILKDYTLIPINDCLTRPKKYQTNYYRGTLNEKPSTFIE